MNIAFFDSGVGGLSVLRESLQHLPNANYFYFADSDNAPYGTKAPQEVHALMLDAVAFLSQFKLDALVIACNTATAVSIATLRQQYAFPIIGMEPAVKLASQLYLGDKKIVVTATSLTLNNRRLTQLIDSLGVVEQVDKIDLDNLVTFAERFDFNSAAVLAYLRKQLGEISHETHAAIVLGCTHFVFYQSLIQRVVGEGVQVVDGNEGTVRQLANLLRKKSPASNSSDIQFFRSGRALSTREAQRLQMLLI